VIYPGSFFLPVFVIALVVFVIVVIYFSALFSKTDIQEKASWSHFAQATGLTYHHPADWLSRAFVTGVYKKYRVRLDTVLRFEGDHGTLNTRFTLRMKMPPLNRAAVSGKDGRAMAKAYLSRLHGLSTDAVRSRLYLGREVGGQLVWRYEYPQMVKSVRFLRASLNQLVAVAEDFPTLVALGGEVVPLLQRAAEEKPSLDFVLPRLLKEVELHSLVRTGNGERRLWCPHCKARYVPVRVALPWTGLKEITYYGCRLCGRSRDYLVGDVVGVLDAGMAEEVERQNGHIRVNWLVGRRVFDFDEVEILRADDEAVERFAVQLGNDTDPQRQKRYGQMRCLVSPQSQLSENSLRILRQRFGEVSARVSARVAAKI